MAALAAAQPRSHEAAAAVGCHGANRSARGSLGSACSGSFGSTSSADSAEASAPCRTPMLPQVISSLIGTRKLPETRRKSSAHAGPHQVSFAHVLPAAHWHTDQNWQVKCEDLRARIASLFNCHNLSDVTFVLEGSRRLPAHAFVLASASPVFQRHLRQEEQDAGAPPWALGAAGSLEGGACLAGEGAPERHRTLVVHDASHAAFFELLRYIYTDSAAITLDNVLPLILLGDTYQLPGLGQRCTEFLRGEVAPGHVLRVLRILEELMLKACLTLWKEVVTEKQAQEKFRALSLFERRNVVDGLAGEIDAPTEARSGSWERLGGGRRSLRASAGSKCSASSGLSGASDHSARWYNSSRRNSSAMEVERGDWEDGSFNLDVAQGFSKKKVTFSTLDTSVRSQLMGYAPLAEEISIQCWKCVQEETGAVISGPDMWCVGLRTLRQLLKLPQCSVPEIALFNAANEWASRRCSLLGLPPGPESKREVLRADDLETLLLIRFPAMTLEQFQWEVVPTGLLEYADVQEVLRIMTNRLAPSGRYVAKPRTGVHVRRRELHQTRRLSLRPWGDRAAAAGDGPSRGAAPAPKQIYAPAPGDAVDSMLGAALLKGFLDGQACQGEPVLAPSACYPRDPAAVALPPISARGRPESRWPTLLAAARPPAARGPGSKGRPGRAAMPSPLAAKEPGPHGHGAGAGGAEPVRPQDFFRLAPGLYRFREASLVEIWLEGGEAVAFDHGPRAQLRGAAPRAAAGGGGTAALRALLGLGARPPADRGVPLASFLCRQ